MVNLTERNYSTWLPKERGVKKDQSGERFRDALCLAEHAPSRVPAYPSLPFPDKTTNCWSIAYSSIQIIFQMVVDTAHGTARLSNY